MNLLKRWRNSEHRDDESTALAKRAHRHDGRGGDLITRLRDEMDQAFDRIWKDFGRDPWAPLADVDRRGFAGNGGGWPAVHMSEDDKSVHFRIDMPGLEERDLDVEVSGNLLTVRGTRDEEHDDEKHGRYERLSGSFVRTLTLPEYVDPAGVDARYAKGVLTVTAPKIPGKGPRRVKVSAT